MLLSCFTMMKLLDCEDKNEYIESLAKYSLLIIDDLGAERNTEYATENVSGRKSGQDSISLIFLWI